MINIKSPIYILQVMCILFVFVESLYIGFVLLKKPIRNSMKGSLIEKESLVLDENINYVQDYDSKIKEKDIWGLNTNSIIDEQSFETQEIYELPSNLRIVAVAIGNPSEIAVENALLNKTVLIKEGEIKDHIRLERVFNDRIILNYQGQAVEYIRKNENK